MGDNKEKQAERELKKAVNDLIEAIREAQRAGVDADDIAEILSRIFLALLNEDDD